MSTLEWIALFGMGAALTLLMIRSAYTTGYDRGFEDGLTMEKFDLPPYERERVLKNGNHD